MNYMTSFSLNFDAAQSAEKAPARAADNQSGTPSGDEFAATLAALWFVPPSQMPPVNVETVSAEAEATTGAQAESATAASLFGASPLPLTRDLPMNPLNDAVPDTLATATAPGDAVNSEDPLIGRPIDSNSALISHSDDNRPTLHPLPPQSDAAAFSISNTMANVMSKLKARVATSEPPDATTPPLALVEVADSVDAASGATIKSPLTEMLQDIAPTAPPPINPLANETKPDALATATGSSEEQLIDRPIDESFVPRLQPHHINDQASQPGEKLASLSKISSLISMATAQTGAIGAATQESFLHRKLQQRSLDPSTNNTAQSEKAAQASLLETAFRELVGDAITDGQPSSRALKADLPALSTSPGAGSTDDNPRPFDHRTQTDAGSLTLAANNPAALHADASATTNSTSAALAPQVVHPMIEMARSLAQRQTRTLRIQLQPDKFGQIDLKLTRDANGRLSAHLTAESTVTRHALAEGISGLRDALEQSGLAVDRLDVSLALNPDGQSGSRSMNEQEAGTATLPTARLFASEASTTDDPQPKPRNEPRRLLNLQI